MPDISMCMDDDCPSKSKCYRHKASGTKPNKYQAYSGYEHDQQSGKCKSYWPINEKEIPK